MIAAKQRQVPGLWGRLKKAGRYVFNRAHGYDAAINTRRRGRRPDTYVRPEWEELNQSDRARVVATLLSFRRNNPLVQSICRLRETDVVGAGIIAQAHSGDEELDAKLEDLWKHFSRAPEVTETMTMREVQQQLASMTLTFGDGGLLLTRTGKIQMVEGDRIGSEENFFNRPGSAQDDPNLIEGVEVNRVGRPVAYHIGTRRDGMLQDVKRIQARNFIFHRKRIRPAQVRGVPELAPVLNDLQDLDELDSIEILSSKVAASLSAVIKREGAMDFELAERANDDADERLQSFEPGQFQYLEPGEDVSVISAGGRPNTDIIDYCIYRLRKVGSALGIPVEWILQTIGETSFSASQGMVLLYQQTCEAEQRNLFPVLSRLWRWKVTNWIATGMIDPPSGTDPFNVSWQPPSFRWINRVAQVKADAAYLTMGAISLDDVCATFGNDVGSTLDRKARNIVLAKRIAAENDIADWRELFNPLTTFANVNLTDLIEMDKG